MITAEQEQFIRKYVSKEYFNVDQVIGYLKLHDVVGGEIFAIAPLPEDRMAHPGRIELLREGFGFNAIDKETFIRRIPFYFYVADYKGNHCGDLKSIISGYYKYTQYGDPNYEEVYQRLERLFYHHKISIVNIMEYTVKQTGYEESSSKLDRAVAIIKACMKDGECSANEVLRQCEDQGIAKRTVNEAKARLNIDSVKRKGGWYWVPGEDSEEDVD